MIYGSDLHFCAFRRLSLNCLSFFDICQSRGREKNGDCCSYPSSNGASTEGWGRCSSPGISEKSVDESSGRRIFAEIPPNVDEEEKVFLAATVSSN